MSNVKSYLDPSIFTDSAAAMDLYDNEVRQGLPYDAFGDKTKFIARVISIPVKVPGKGKGTLTSTWSFRARIVDDPSPHWFLPDPCDPSIAPSDREVQKLIACHTSFVGSTEEAPIINSFVTVQLNKNVFSYDLQFGKYIGPVPNPAETPAFGRISCVGACTSLVDLVENAPRSLIFGDIQVTGEHGLAATLQREYQNLYKEDTANRDKIPVDESTLYNKLISGIGIPNLVIGIIANAVAESTLNPTVVSRKEGEASLGLWQMNVGEKGRVGVPKDGINKIAAARLPADLRLDKKFKKIPYFAGSLLAAERGIPIVSKDAYAQKPQDVSLIYRNVAHEDHQIKFVIKYAKILLEGVEDSAGHSSKDWADWWQIYFEQPEEIISRGPEARQVEQKLSGRG